LVAAFATVAGTAAVAVRAAVGAAVASRAKLGGATAYAPATIPARIMTESFIAPVALNPQA
jgi:hypothetical protein